MDSLRYYWPMPFKYFVYIVECNDGSLYTGWTNDLDKRIEKHNSGAGAKYTRAHRPVKLVHAENFTSRREAMQREHAIKVLSRAEKLQLL